MADDRKLLDDTRDGGAVCVDNYISFITTTNFARNHDDCHSAPLLVLHPSLQVPFLEGCSSIIGIVRVLKEFEVT